MIQIGNILRIINHLLILLKKNHRIFIYSLIFISILIKLIMLLTYNISQPPDARKYVNIIKYLGETHNIESNLKLSLKIISISPYMKIYPILIYFFGKTAIQILQILFSSIAIYLIFHICKFLTKDIITACIAAFLFFMNPFFIYYSLLFQYETLFMFFILLGIFLFLKNLKITSYFFLILCIFFNPVIEIGLIVFVFLSSKYFFNCSLIKSFKNVFLFLCIYSIFLSFSVYNNYKVFGSYERFYTNSILALEYNEVYEKHGLNFEKIEDFFKEITKDECPENLNKKNDLVYRLTELKMCTEKVLNEYAFNYIKNSKNWGQIIKNIFVRAGRLFSIYPYDTNEFHVKIVSSIYYIFLYFFLLVFILKLHFLNNKNFYPYIFLCLISLSIYLLLHAVFRYRVSYDPLLILFASYSIKNLINSTNQRYYEKKKFKT